MKVLILDDSLGRHEMFNAIFKDEGITPKNVYTARQCIEQLSTQVWDFVFLDHDLDMAENNNAETGMSVVHFVVDTIIARRVRDHLSRSRYVVHSMNDFYGKQMVRTLEYMAPFVRYEPEIWTRPEDINKLIYNEWPS